MLKTYILLMCLVILSVTAAPIEKRAKKFHGTGTWYDPSNNIYSRRYIIQLVKSNIMYLYRFVPEKEGGIYGACGPKEDSESMIVAMNAEQYGNMNQKSKYCGKKLMLKGL